MDFFFLEIRPPTSFLHTRPPAILSPSVPASLLKRSPPCTAAPHSADTHVKVAEAVDVARDYDDDDDLKAAVGSAGVVALLRL